MNPTSTLPLLILAAGLLSPHFKGEAYLDPGSGSFILQLLLATLLGSLFLLKTFWRRVIGFIRNLFPSPLKGRGAGSGTEGSRSGEGGEQSDDQGQ